LQLSNFATGPHNITVLGIETSCDETGAAVYTTNNGIISNALFSQIAFHIPYGGVVPELASRSQIERINTIVDAALQQASVDLDSIDVIAVTSKPGLSGSLLVGLCFAKALAYAKQKKFIGINHLEGHAFSAHIEHDIPFPYICLTASGGHTALYLVEGFGSYKILGRTLDDAAGEAFDKIARLLGLPYPGGPVIEKLAEQIGFVDDLHYPRLKMRGLDFSFSGLKTAVLYDLAKRGLYDMTSKKSLLHDAKNSENIYLQQQVASSLLVAIGDIFQDRLQQALALYPSVQAITFVGGVACNKYLQQRLALFAQKNKKLFFFPAKEYCTDNGAMIAFVGHYKAQQGLFSDLAIDIF